mmetsp:Transcript_42148/g.64639  ORF Transcript_42148/g.64639 Transcript_42148/m.64639 type:complete len:555 (-) Transcript_42148:60-1724(-)|eukprot:CAMPEP_0170491054 /NCGR_PEP_ID=MMETSP0208-20121228/10297_1 /TAXON_ID=197538 /ORGANISM="Strombidium inclinatum, Strain S3" /LENGTH=554 /DNA_ID=CAMNT_0010766559 /DNA_START=1 /DNA_END=1665 /DNA_ORIENTATION=+
MNFRTLLALTLGVVVTRFDSSSAVVNAEAVQPPLKLRASLDVWKKALSLRDQEVLKVFENLEVTDSGKFSDVTVSVEPVDGNFDDFDFDLHLSADYLGGESSALGISGNGYYDGKEFAFSGPVKTTKLQYGLGTKRNNDFDYDAFVFEEKEWVFDIDTAAFSAQGLDADASAELIKLVSDTVSTRKDATKSGKEEVAKIFPMDTAVPYVALFYAVQFADKVDFSDKFLDLGFSFEKMNLLTDRQKKALKAIEGSFYKETNAKGENALFQVQLDDNLFNSVTAILTSIDKMFSVRELVKGNAKAAPIVQMLTTTTVGTVLPDFVENYGQGKKIDVIFTPSHSFFLDGFKDSKMSGIYMDKNGNWKIQVNAAFQLNVETLPDMWDVARNIYATVVVKLKVTTDESNPDNKKLILLPKNIEITKLKVLSGETPMEMEQMMIQSLANIQLEQAKKFLKDIPLNISDLLKKNPKELQCLGFNLSDLDVSFKKSQVQLSGYYKDVEKPNKAVCDAFLRDIKNAPQMLKDQLEKTGPIGESLKGLTDMAEGLGENLKKGDK